MNKEGEVTSGVSMDQNSDEVTANVDERDKVDESVNVMETMRDDTVSVNAPVEDTVSSPNLNTHSKTASGNCVNVDDSSYVNDEVNKEKFTYAKILKKDVNNFTKELVFIAPSVNKDGEETVVFDEEIVQKK